ncbi:hypothetical protein [Bradyrhizobium sp. 192]|uniref:hypothetical protein n=1 Tax=Bradyrhizobium sp. 192 TaxID=2782660 RepID=UPI0020002DB9|nr:hypothetical protein [Bradyrhizobium sp. 192]UPJ60291.1 hypothetical protein IVB24_12005 [Bradyrhizobium sp. 192]
MLEAIKCNKRHSGYEWVTALAQIIRTNANPQDGGTKQRQPAWKQFDDTHHWDTAAEEWVPNLDH